jgi:hypothetical protein
MRPEVEVSGPVALEKEIARKADVRIVYGSALSNRVYAFTVLCDPADADCEQARARLLASGMFIDVSPDQRRRHQ